MFSWARRPLGTVTLWLNGNVAKSSQELRNSGKDLLGPEVRRDLRFFLPFLLFLNVPLNSVAPSRDNPEIQESISRAGGAHVAPLRFYLRFSLRALRALL